MLSEAEYRHLIRNKEILEGKINSANTDKETYDVLKKKAKALKEHLEQEMSTYNGFVGDALEEYEEAHPPEE